MCSGTEQPRKNQTISISGGSESASSMLIAGLEGFALIQ